MRHKFPGFRRGSEEGRPTKYRPTGTAKFGPYEALARTYSIETLWFAS